MTRYPLLPITAALAAGIGAAPHFYLTAWEQVFLVSLVLLMAALLLRAGRTASGLLVALLGFFLCGTFLAAEEHVALPANHIERLAGEGRFRPEKPSQLLGWARTPSVKTCSGEYFDFEVSEIKQEGQTGPTQGAIRVYYSPRLRSPDSPSLAVPYGARLGLSFRPRVLRRPRNFGNPGAFDYEAYLRRQGVDLTGVVRPEEMTQLPGNEGNRWRAALYDLRSRLLGYLDRRFPSGPGQTSQGAILKAVLLGDDSGLDLNTESDFQASGTYHVLVVSGLHVSALAVALLWLFSLLRMPRSWSTMLAAASGVTFAALAGGSTPVVRAALMVMIYLAARLVYRGRVLLNSIAAAALVLLILRPSDLGDPSFDLSFLAVLVLAGIGLPILQWKVSPYRRALREIGEREQDKLLEPRQAQFRMDARVVLDYLCGLPPLAERTGPWVRRGLETGASGTLFLLEALVFALSMQAGFALVMASYFHRTAWAGILANLLIFPITGLLIPAGFLVLGVSLVSWPAAALGGGLLEGLAAALQGVAGWSAHLAGGSRRVPTPPLWLAVGFLGLLLGVAILLEARSRWYWLPAAGLLGLWVVLTIAPFPPAFSPGKLEVTALDVGQGDSLFVAFPGGKTMLVDAGEGPSCYNESSQPVGLDLGESVVSSYLWTRRVQRLDFIVATHSHYDHVGGLPSVLKNFRVGALWLGPGSEPWAGRREALAAGRLPPLQEQFAGLRRKIDDVEVEVLWPPPGWVPTHNANNDSLVLRLGYGRRHLLLPGDAEATVERRLMRASVPLRSDILKVSHHGSNDATDAPFLERVGPTFSVISVGAYGHYGHPRQETLARLREAGARIYRTDRDGATSILTDGNRIEITTFQETRRPWPPFLPPQPARFSGAPR